MYGVEKITVTDDVALVTFNKIPCSVGFISDIFAAFSKNNINIDMISQSAPFSQNTSLSFTVSSENVMQVLELINAFRESNPNVKPMVSVGNCKIQLFGEEMRTASGVAAKALATVSHTIDQLMLVTTSEVDISLLMTQHHLADAVSALCKEFALDAPVNL